MQYTKKQLIIGSLAIVLIGAGIGIGGYQLLKEEPNNNNIEDNQPTENTSGLVRECPDSWYINKMPVIIDDSRDGGSPTLPINEEYFIINDQKKDPANYDLEWIKDNCEVNEPSYVY